MDRKKLFFFFIDGVGIGENDPEHNPLTGLFAPFIKNRPFAGVSVPHIEDETVLLPVDPLLGVEGVPQSATGQTTIMTGINAAAYLGYHLLAFPNQQLLPLIKEHSLFRRLSRHGVKVTSANLYSRSFFTERRKRRRNMFPVSTLSVEAAGLPFRYLEDYQQQKAVFTDITNEMLIERGYPVERISPGEASRRISLIMEDHDLVFFEYFLTDTYGHSREREKLLHSVEIINEFLISVRGESREQTDIMVISDHGNAEDMHTGDHTYNPVPFLLLSRRAEALAPAWKKVRSLTDISPFVLEYFNIPPESA